MKLRIICLFVFSLMSCQVTINPISKLVFSANRVDFGNVLLMNKVTHDIKLTNNGSKKAILRDIQLKIQDSNTQDDEFKINPQSIANDQLISKKDIFTVTVEFMPITKGEKSAKLIYTFIINGEEVIEEIPITGIGYVGYIKIDPTIIQFPTIIVGDQKSDQFTIENVYYKDVTINSIEIDDLGINTQDGDFSIIAGWNGTPLQIASDSSINISVKFSPQSYKDKSAKVIVKIAESNEEFICLLKGPCFEKLEISTPQILPDGEHGKSYSQLINCVGGDGIYTLGLYNSVLPSGLQLVNNVLKGNPQEHGDFLFAIQVKDNSGQSAIKSFSLHINYARLIRDPLDFDPIYCFSNTNNTGYFTINLISEGDIPLTINSISLSGSGFNSGEASIDSQPGLPLKLNPGASTQIIIKVVSLIDIERSVILTVNHTGYNTPFSEQFEWRVERRFMFLLDCSDRTSQPGGSGSVYDINGNLIVNATFLQYLQWYYAEQIKDLTQYDSFEIIAFNTQANKCFSKLVKATTQNKIVGITWLYNLTYSGSCTLYDTLFTVFNHYGYLDKVDLTTAGVITDNSSIIQDIEAWTYPHIVNNSNFFFNVRFRPSIFSTLFIQIAALPNCGIGMI